MAWEGIHLYHYYSFAYIYVHLRFIARIAAGLVENGTGILSSVLLGLGSALLQGNVSYGRDEKDGMESIYMSNI